MLKYYLIYISAIIITSISQILLKIGANRGKSKSYLYSFFNFFTIIGYFFLLLSTVFSLYALRVISLKITIVMLPLVYIFVGFLSFVILKEYFSKIKLIGSIIIIIGILIFNI